MADFLNLEQSRHCQIFHSCSSSCRTSKCWEQWWREEEFQPGQSSNQTNCHRDWRGSSCLWIQKLPERLLFLYCSVFWPSLTPSADPVKLLWFKMVCTCVLHIALHVLSSTSISGGYFRPRKSISAKIAIFGCFLGLFTPPLGCHFGDIETCNA